MYATISYKFPFITSSVIKKAFTFLIVFFSKGGVNECETETVGITIDDNQNWPWKVAYSRSDTIEFEMLESNLTSAVSNIVKCLSSIFNKALVNVQVTWPYNYFYAVAFYLLINKWLHVNAQQSSVKSCKNKVNPFSPKQPVTGSADSRLLYRLRHNQF